MSNLWSENREFENEKKIGVLEYKKVARNGNSEKTTTMGCGNDFPILFWVLKDKFDRTILEKDKTAWKSFICSYTIMFCSLFKSFKGFLYHLVHL